MNSKPIDWDHVERVFIYIILFALFTLQGINYFIPIFSAFALEKHQTIILFAVTLALFKYFDKSLRRLSKRSEFVSSFNEAMSKVLKYNERVDSVDIYAMTLARFSGSLWGVAPHIRRLRIIVRDPALGETVIYPNSIANLLNTSTMGHMRDMKDFKAQDFVEDLQLKTIQYDPHLFFIIVNGQRGFWGLFSPCPGDENLPTVSPCYVFDNSSFADRETILLLENWFENMFQNYASDATI